MADLLHLWGPAAYQVAGASTHHLETSRARGLETLLTLQKAAQDIKVKLSIVECWHPPQQNGKKLRPWGTCTNSGGLWITLSTLWWHGCLN